MKYLVIVESPTKAKTISRFLGDDYSIKYSMGHVMDLPKSKLGVNVEDNFAPQYEIMADKKKMITELRAAAKGVDMIYLATDPDREGEAISANIEELLTTKSKKETFKRIVFHEITETAIKHAIESPRTVDTNLVNAQTARRVLDRLVGYQLSPLLWKKVRRGLSAGRVQSVALRLIVEREREIEKFAKEPYWTVSANLEKEKSKSDHAVFELIEINGKKIDLQSKFQLYVGEYSTTKTVIDTEEKAKEIVTDLKNKQFFVSDVSERQMKRSPLPPFTTSTLQQEAARRFSYPGKRTMSLAQKLYEEGFITYHRTDSVTMADTAIAAIREYVKASYGEKYIPASIRHYTAKQKSAQEAHEAIRPTKMNIILDGVKGTLGPDYGKLYDLIWRRAVSSQMADALIESTTIYVDTKNDHSGVAATTTRLDSAKRVGSQSNVNSTYRLKATGSVLAFDGFLKINPQALQDTRLPRFSAEEILKAKSIIDEPHQTAPPPRYNDASLIATLEEKGIGRPSTYASIIGTIADRSYIERVERRFQPTSIGMAVNDFLVMNFSTIDDIPFTAGMEDKLDEIAEGKKGWIAMMKEFYDPFKKKLGEVENADRVKIAVEDTGELCPECKEGNLVIRQGKFGKFLSCARFPDCRFTKPLIKDMDIPCPKDAGKVIQRKTRKGRLFYGCANYPNCDFAVWKLEDIPGYKEKKTAEDGHSVPEGEKETVTPKAAIA